MKIHPVVGADILERVRFPYPVVPIVRSHHEWWNGSGYPDGLKGDAIPIGARVLSAVDCFDALVSDRPYRKGIPIAEALAMVRSMSGIQFDPQVVTVMDALYANMGQSDAGQKGRFTPLNTDVAVRRGEAPGAGFEASRGSREVAQPFSLDSAYGELLQEQESLNLIAAARHQAQTLFELHQPRPDANQSAALSMTESLQLMSTRLRRLIPFDSCALYLLDGESLSLRYVDGDSARAFSSEPISLGEGISGWVAQSGKPILNGNAGVERTYHASSQGGPGSETELRAALSVPLRNLQQEVFSVLTLYSVSADFFERNHLRMLEAMSSKLALSLLQALNPRQAQPESETDPLTGLPSGGGLYLQLGRQLILSSRAGIGLSVVVCDLKGFPQVSEQRGQAAANRLLCLVADAFRQICQPGDVVARVGSAEFVLLLHAVEEQALQERLGEIALAVQAASRRAALGLAVSASLGTAHFPTDAVTAEELLAVAERRMILQKLAGRQNRSVIAISERRPASAQ